MDGKQNLYYALGILAYALAKSDGVIQKEERQKLFEIVREEVDHNINFDYAEIIFQLLERNGAGYERTYAWAIAEIEKGRHYLTPELKEKMVEVLVKIADSFDHISEVENKLIERFERDIQKIGSTHSLE